MKITQTIALASAAILVAGCAHEKHEAQYDESIAPHATQSSQDNSGQYNTYRNSSTVSTASKSDDALVAEVRQSLQQDPQIAPLLSGIQITADKGMVVLSGSVQSAEQKRQIESIVAGASGVDIVDDQLHVSGSAMSPTSRPDAGSHIYSNAGGKASNQPANPTVNGGDNSVTPSDADNGKNNDGRLLNPTSDDTNGAPRIYHDSGSNMNDSTNSALSPTSRTNGENQIYQQNQDQNSQGLNTNGNNKIP
jgi:hypothetical protein